MRSVIDMKRKHVLLALATSALAISPITTMPALAQGNSGVETATVTDDQTGFSVELPSGVTEDMLGKSDPKIIAVQVMLDRSRHSPGVVDGLMGGNTKRAIRYYREAHGLSAGSAVDKELLQSLLDTSGGDIFDTYTITQDDVSRGFTNIPSGFAEKASLDRLGYKNAQEMLAERFHMDQDFLRDLNPDANFMQAGTEIVITARDNVSISQDIARIEIRKNENTVAAFDGSGNLVASYPATIGSGTFPSPSGSMEVRAIAPEPVYYFDPEGREWGPDEKLEIAAGPNNPVGGTWIDLTKEGYGIHGSPDPQMVGKRTSHGCVRLTNWDAEQLAEAVSAGVAVEFT